MNEAAATVLERDGLVITGADATTFLQGQLSQDVLVLDAGSSGWSLLLEPTGKMVALVRVTRTGDEQFLIDLEAGYGDLVAERLARFLIRIKVEIDPVALTMLAVRGPGASTIEAEGVVRHDPGWPGTEALDVVAPVAAETGEAPAPGWPVSHAVGWPALPARGWDDLERLRIRSGIPSMGREIEPDVIPAELEIVDRTVSFDKGCYTGQELVARIDSRGGNVPRRLRVIEIAGAVPPVGAVVHLGEAESGTLSSVQPTESGGVALGLLHRRVEAPCEVTVAWGAGDAGAAGEAPAQVQPVPDQGV